MANKKKHHGPFNSHTILVREHEQLKKHCEELEIQNTSFGLCLSAMVLKYGDPAWEKVEGEDEQIVGDQYIFRLADFQSASGTRLTIESLADVEGSAGTVVKVIRSKDQEAAVTNGET